MWGLPTWTHIYPFIATLSWWQKIAVGRCPFSGDSYPISSLGPLSSVLSAADWLLRNTKERNPISALTTLNEAFGIEGFTISITWSWILMHWWDFNKGSAMAFPVDEWVTPDVGNRRQGKILQATLNYKCCWVTSKNSSDCQRLIANMKKQKDRYSILPMLANMATRLWRFVQMVHIFP